MYTFFISSSVMGCVLFPIFSQRFKSNCFKILDKYHKFLGGKYFFIIKKVGHIVNVEGRFILAHLENY